jgi:hypothetical protein
MLLCLFEIIQTPANALHPCLAVSSLPQVSKIFSEVDASQLEVAATGTQQQQQQEEANLTPEEFAQMRRDVELLGESAEACSCCVCCLRCELTLLPRRL